jgi:uncharacterized MAPEG superfamily protein
MPIELQMLVWATVLGLVHLFATVPVVIFQHGFKYVLSPRDEQRAMTGVSARLNRAFANFLETFPFFVAAVVAAQLLGRHEPLIATGAIVYVAARVIYVPIYLLGLPVLRTLVWLASYAGIAVIVAGLF